jgi:hypothetical protein
MQTTSPADKRRVTFFRFPEIESVRPEQAAPEDCPRPARDVPRGKRWTFPEHRTVAELIALGLF